MTPMEIALLVIGIILFVASFIIPEMKDKNLPAEGLVPEEEVKRAVRQEMEGYQGKIGEVVDETVHYAVEKTERSLDKLSNEKIMAVSEYSDTVLQEIDKNHKEIMFLYDMLSEKETTLKNTVQEAEQTQKAARQTAQVIDEKTRNAKETAQVVEGAISTVRAAVTGGGGTITTSEISGADGVGRDDFDGFGANSASGDSDAPEISGGGAFGEGQEFVGGIIGREAGAGEKARTPGADLYPESGDDAGKNSNERILDLHQQGKSKMAIAKELGLGLGEVQLVIDLFEGARG